MPRRNRIRPTEAARAMRALAADPDDTAQAFRVIAAMSGRSGERLYRRFERSAGGRRALAERRELFDVLSDLERLRAMPDGSLGAAIADFFEREQISAQGLVDASVVASGDGIDASADGGREFLGRRLRDLHDVFHVLTGYGRDLRGEAAVLAFTIPQTRNPGIAYLVLYALRRAGWRSEMGRLIRSAFMRGARSAWLVDQEWEALLERPLDAVRDELGIGPPPCYEQVRSAAAPTLA